MRAETPTTAAAGTVQRQRPRPAVRALGSSDLEFAAALHLDALPHGFSSRFGPAFLRVYYRSFIDSPHAIAIAAVVDGRPVGVLVGTHHDRAHYAWVARRFEARRVLRGALAVLARPRVVGSLVRRRTARALRLLRRLRDRRQTAAPGAAREPDAAVLTQVSVSRDARRRGVGRALVGAFLEQARSAGAVEARLITLADGGAAGFYRALGWTYAGERAGPNEETVATFTTALDEPAER